MAESIATKKRTIVGATFSKPSYIALIGILTIVISVALYYLSLRSAGIKTTIFTTSLTTPGFWLEKFGSEYLLTTVALDVTIAALMSITIALTVASRHAARASGACSLTSLAIGVTTAGCPTCVVPLLGTFGIVFFSASLPLLGLEFQLMSVAVLVAGLIWIVRSSTT